MSAVHFQHIATHEEILKHMKSANATRQPKPAKLHRYITTALVVISACILIYRMLAYLKRTILLKVPKVEVKQKLDTENGIFRAAVNASNANGSTDGGASKKKSFSRRKV